MGIEFKEGGTSVRTRSVYRLTAQGAGNGLLMLNGGAVSCSVPSGDWKPLGLAITSTEHEWTDFDPGEEYTVAYSPSDGMYEVSAPGGFRTVGFHKDTLRVFAVDKCPEHGAIVPVSVTHPGEGNSQSLRVEIPSGGADVLKRWSSGTNAEIRVAMVSAGPGEGGDRAYLICSGADGEWMCVLIGPGGGRQSMIEITRWLAYISDPYLSERELADPDSAENWKDADWGRLMQDAGDGPAWYPYCNTRAESYSDAMSRHAGRALNALLPVRLVLDRRGVPVSLQADGYSRDGVDGVRPPSPEWDHGTGFTVLSVNGLPYSSESEVSQMSWPAARVTESTSEESPGHYEITAPFALGLAYDGGRPAGLASYLAVRGVSLSDGMVSLSGLLDAACDGYASPYSKVSPYGEFAWTFPDDSDYGEPSRSGMAESRKNPGGYPGVGGSFDGYSDELPPVPESVVFEGDGDAEVDLGNLPKVHGWLRMAMECGFNDMRAWFFKDGRRIEMSGTAPVQSSGYPTKVSVQRPRFVDETPEGVTARLVIQPWAGGEWDRAIPPSGIPVVCRPDASLYIRVVSERADDRYVNGWAEYRVVIYAIHPDDWYDDGTSGGGGGDSPEAGGDDPAEEDEGNPGGAQQGSGSGEETGETDEREPLMAAAYDEEEDRWEIVVDTAVSAADFTRQGDESPYMEFPIDWYAWHTGGRIAVRAGEFTRTTPTGYSQSLKPLEYWFTQTSPGTVVCEITMRKTDFE